MSVDPLRVVSAPRLPSPLPLASSFSPFVPGRCSCRRMPIRAHDNSRTPHPRPPVFPTLYTGLHPMLVSSSEPLVLRYTLRISSPPPSPAVSLSPNSVLYSWSSD